MAYRKELVQKSSMVFVLCHCYFCKETRQDSSLCQWRKRVVTSSVVKGAEWSLGSVPGKHWPCFQSHPAVSWQAGAQHPASPAPLPRLGQAVPSQCL